MSKLEHALALARRGFKLFPIVPGTKGQPMLTNWPQLATADEKLITMQWGPQGTPDANIGIHCEGLLVIDVDVKKGGQESFSALQEMMDLPATLTHRTPSGGVHALYRLPAGHPGVPNSVEELGKGLDIRSTSGYVVAPGSTVEAGEYSVFAERDIADAPGWLVHRLGTSTPRVQTEKVYVPDAPNASVERAREWLWTAERSVKGAGGDQAAYRVACRLRDLGMSYEQACELMRSEAWEWGCGWRDGRLEEKPIRSAYRYAQNEGGGGQGVVEDDLAVPSNEPVAPAKPKKRSRVMRADEYAAEEGRGPGYVVKNLLNRGSYAVAYGAPGAGKTFVMLDIGYHVAAGKPWMGLNVRGGTVLYLAYEGVGGLKKRAKALQQKYGRDLGAFYIVGATMNLREQAGRQELGQILAELPEKPVLIVIDTFARALMGGDENSAQDVGAFNDAIAKLIDNTGACVVMIHHSGKNKAAGARGSSAILGAIDTELEIDMGMLTPSKQRDVEIIASIPFKLQPTVVGIDEDGDEEKSCVVMPAAGAVKGRKDLKGNYELAFRVLCELTGEANEPISLNAWKAKLSEVGVLPPTDSARKRFYDLSSKLTSWGYIMVEENVVRRGLR